MFNSMLKLKTYHTADDGAVTVDWVVLVSAVALLSLPALGFIRGGTKEMAENVSGTLEEMEVGSTSLPKP